MSTVGPLPPRDPAPSRLKYRMERLWLTPIYRSLIRTGVPICILLILTLNYLKDPDNQTHLAQSVHNAQARIEARPEFAVKLMKISGASDQVAERVRQSVPMQFPQSSLRLDLADLKIQIEGVAAVKTADLRVHDGVLLIDITERVPAVIWRNGAELHLVDTDGHGAGQVDSRLTHPDLPLIAGVGADDAVPEALSLFAASGALRDRVRGLRRVGERRWDLMLDRDQIIQLPEIDPLPALQRVVALHLARDLLNRDVTIVDMRDGRRPTIRLTAPAVTELYRLRAIADGEET